MRGATRGLVAAEARILQQAQGAVHADAAEARRHLGAKLAQRAQARMVVQQGLRALRQEAAL